MGEQTTHQVLVEDQNVHGRNVGSGTKVTELDRFRATRPPEPHEWSSPDFVEKHRQSLVDISQHEDNNAFVETLHRNLRFVSIASNCDTLCRTVMSVDLRGYTRLHLTNMLRMVYRGSSKSEEDHTHGRCTSHFTSPGYDDTRPHQLKFLTVSPAGELEHGSFSSHSKKHTFLCEWSPARCAWSRRRTLDSL